MPNNENNRRSILLDAEGNIIRRDTDFSSGESIRQGIRDGHLTAEFGVDMATEDSRDATISACIPIGISAEETYRRFYEAPRYNRLALPEEYRCIVDEAEAIQYRLELERELMINIRSRMGVWHTGQTNSFFSVGTELTDEEKERIKKREEEIKAVKERAKKLLLSLLTPPQRTQYEEHGYFEITKLRRTGQRVTYRIKTGRNLNIELFDANGKKVTDYCIHPKPYVPDEDTMAAQLLLIQTDEEEFLRVANEWPGQVVPEFRPYAQEPRHGLRYRY